MLTKAPRGTRDILPGEVEKWQLVERTAAEVCRLFGYAEIRTPVFEHTELFLRGVGETTDIVSKEMYTFQDRGGRSITLRPENTAAVCRAYLEHKLYAETQPLKLFYIGPMFRYDRPQAGRFRQFHQFGVEVFGSKDPMLDAEVILLAMTFFRSLGLKELELRVNSVGCPRCRSEYRVKLQDYLRDKLPGFCRDCAQRFEKNPLRILDCKEKTCQELSAGAPEMPDSLCEECAVHFEQVRKTLEALGEHYTWDKRLVRGLDYYTNTAFEILAGGLGAQNAVCGGGRYDNLMSTIGGPDTPGIGFAIGLERVLLAMEAAGVAVPASGAADAFVAVAGDVPAEAALKLVMELRRAGVSAEKDYLGRSLKAQFKYADKKAVRFIVILGEEEYRTGQAVVRDMKSGEQKTVGLDEMVPYLAALTKEEK